MARIRVVRPWPLVFAALAVVLLFYLLSGLREDLPFSLRGTKTVGWYQDFGPFVGDDGDPYFIYAYKAQNRTYSGRGFYNDEDSDIYYRKVGDPIGVTYLTLEPWTSTAKAVTWNLKQSSVLAVVSLVIFLGGLWFAIRLGPPSLPGGYQNPTGAGDRAGGEENR